MKLLLLRSFFIKKQKIEETWKTYKKIEYKVLNSDSNLINNLVFEWVFLSVKICCNNY